MGGFYASEEMAAERGQTSGRASGSQDTADRVQLVLSLNFRSAFRIQLFEDLGMMIQFWGGDLGMMMQFFGDLGMMIMGLVAAVCGGPDFGNIHRYLPRLAVCLRPFRVKGLHGVIAGSKELFTALF